MKIPDSEILIDAMMLNDVEAVKRIEQEANLSPWPAGDYQKRILEKDSVAMVARDGGKVVGFLLARLITMVNTTFESESELYNIAISKSHRKQGIGRRLLERLFALLSSEDIPGIWLEVRESNETAINFYLNRGFKVEFIRKDYYTLPTENALVLKKSVFTRRERLD